MNEHTKIWNRGKELCRKENGSQGGVGIPTCPKTIQFHMTVSTVGKETIHTLVWERSLRQTLQRIQTGNIGAWQVSKRSNRECKQKMSAGKTEEETVNRHSQQKIVCVKRQKKIWVHKVSAHTHLMSTTQVMEKTSKILLDEKAFRAEMHPVS